MKNVNLTATAAFAMCLSFVSPKLRSQENNHHKNYIDIGVLGGMQNSRSGIAGVYGAFGTYFHAFGRPAALDIRVKEGYISNPHQEGALITVTYRTGIVKGLFVGVGGAHGHQVPGDEFMTH